MIFSSLIFIYAFLPLSILIYYIVPKGFRNKVMLCLSVIFCGIQGLNFLGFMAAYTLLHFAEGILLGKIRHKKIISYTILAAVILADIIILLIFREKLFINDYVPEIFVPIGISFSTLSAIGYCLDVCRGKIRAEKNFFRFSLYMLFFPKLPMGPIINYSSFRRMTKYRTMGINEIGAGMVVFVKGLAKKILFADNIYILYAAVMGININELSAISAVLGVIAYGLCLYFTLSGLSDMGAGLARCFGFRLPQSFNYPISSRGLGEFSSRWHMTVTGWFSRYILKPLKQKSSSRILESLAVIFIWSILGLWYDLRLNTLIGGFLIGAVIAAEKFIFTKKNSSFTSMIYTFFVISLCTVFFMWDTPIHSLKYLLVIVGGNNSIIDPASIYLLKVFIVVLLICLYGATDIFRNIVERSGKKWIKVLSNIVTPITTLILLILCTAEISYTGASEMTLPILGGAVI